MSIFGAEVIGTALLILLGNGVVAGVLLSQSKAENARLDRHHLRLGHGRHGRRVRRRPVQRRAPEPGGHVRASRSRATTEWGDVPKYLAGEFVGRVHRRDAGLAGVPRPLARDRGPGAQARRASARRRRSATRSPNIDHRGRSGRSCSCSACWRSSPTRRRRRPASAACSSACWCSRIGLSLGGPTGYAINPARDLGPRIMHAILPIAGKGPSDWSYAWIPVVGPAHRRRARRGSRSSCSTRRADRRGARHPEGRSDGGDVRWRSTRQRSIRAPPARGA